MKRMFMLSVCLIFLTSCAGNNKISFTQGADTSPCADGTAGTVTNLLFINVEGSTLSTKKSQSNDAQDFLNPVVEAGKELLGTAKEIVNIPEKSPVVIEPLPIDPPILKKTIVPSAWYRGRTQDAALPTWYFDKDMSAYPAEFLLNVPGCSTDIPVTNNGTRWTGSGYIVKQSDVAGRGMSVLAPNSCKAPKTIHVSY